MTNKFRYVNLPSELVEAIENYIKETGRYTSIASFVQEACRIRLEQLSGKSVKESAVQ